MQHNSGRVLMWCYFPAEFLGLHVPDQIISIQEENLNEVAMDSLIRWFQIPKME